MAMMNRKDQSGLTLIEILLAMVVLVVGIVGILALFPAAIGSGKETVEQQTAAMMASSIQNSIMSAAKLAEVDDKGNYTIRFSHDLSDGTNKLVYTFVLPKLPAAGQVNDWQLHPGGTTVTLNKEDDAKNLEAAAAFTLGSDPWVAKTVKDTRNFDTSEPYDQYMFSLAVKKIDTLAYEATMPADEKEKKTKLYECKIAIFRKGGPGAAGGTGSGTPKVYIGDFHCRFSVR